MLKYHPCKISYLLHVPCLTLCSSDWFHQVETNKICQHNGHEQKIVLIVLILEWSKSDSEQIA